MPQTQTPAQAATQYCQQHGQLSFNIPFTHIPVTISLSATGGPLNFSSTNGINTVFPLFPWPDWLAGGASVDFTINAPAQPTANPSVGLGKNLSLGYFTTRNGPQGISLSVGPSVGPPHQHCGSNQQYLRHGGRGKLMHKVSSENPRVFKAGRFWDFNVVGAAVGGAGAVVLMLTMMILVVWLNPTPHNVLFAAVVALILVASVLCFLAGNLIAVYPYAVLLEEGEGLELRAPLKRLYVPIQDIRDVQKSYLQPGYVVRLRRRHRLLKSFLIPWYFGDQAEPLANAIREEIRRQSP